MNERTVGLVAQQPGLVLVMSGVDVDFDSHAYTDEISFLRAEALSDCTTSEQRGTTIGVADDQSWFREPTVGVAGGLLCRLGSPPTDDAQGPVATGPDVGRLSCCQGGGK